MQKDFDQNSGILEFVKTSPLIRVILLGFLVLLLQIAVFRIQGIIVARQETRSRAINEVTSIWGGPQEIIGPILVVPYRIKIVESKNNKEGEEIIRTVLRHASFLPDNLQITGTARSEIRYRGIYKIPLYRFSAKVEATFSNPDFSGWEVPAENIYWDRAHLMVQISGVRAIQGKTVLSWNGKEIDFLPGSGESRGDSGIHVPLGRGVQMEALEFSFPLALNGNDALHFAPLGKQTIVKLQSNWKDPSFRGNWLPVERTVRTEGFSARWEITYLGRNFDQKSAASGFGKALPKSLFGVGFITPINHYRMAIRSVEYSALFLILTFGCFWLFEVIGGVRIYSLQYLLMGFAMCLFYLLELSLSEHLGFNISYMIASLAVIAVTAGYSFYVLGSAKRAILIFLVMAVLYGYLYMVLKNQDYALLVGSIGLFAGLAAVMFLTRKIDWGEVGKKPPTSNVKTPKG